MKYVNFIKVENKYAKIHYENFPPKVCNASENFCMSLYTNIYAI